MSEKQSQNALLHPSRSGALVAANTSTSTAFRPCPNARHDFISRNAAASPGGLRAFPIRRGRGSVVRELTPPCSAATVKRPFSCPNNRCPKVSGKAQTFTAMNGLLRRGDKRCMAAPLTPAEDQFDLISTVPKRRDMLDLHSTSRIHLGFQIIR